MSLISTHLTAHPQVCQTAHEMAGLNRISRTNQIQALESALLYKEKQAGVTDKELMQKGKDAQRGR